MTDVATVIAGSTRPREEPTSALMDRTSNSSLDRAISSATPISALMFRSTASELVAHVNVLNSDVNATHASALAHELSVRTQQRAKASPQTMLAQLGEMGFSWRSVAHMLGVSVPAVQKWRRGEGVTGENRRKLAMLLSTLDVIASQFTVDAIESWFEMPITDRSPVTPTELWAAGEYVLVLRYAGGQITGEGALDEFEPSWRDIWRSDFTTVRGEDGHLSLERRE